MRSCSKPVRASQSSTGAAAAPVLKWLDQSRFESERMRRAAEALR